MHSPRELKVGYSLIIAILSDWTNLFYFVITVSDWNSNQKLGQNLNSYTWWDLTSLGWNVFENVGLVPPVYVILWMSASYVIRVSFPRDDWVAWLCEIKHKVQVDLESATQWFNQWINRWIDWWIDRQFDSVTNKRLIESFVES